MNLTGQKRHFNPDFLWKESCLRLRYQDQTNEGYNKSAQQHFSSESLCLALDFYSIGKPHQVLFFVDVTNACKWFKCSISEICCRRVTTCTQTHSPVTRAFSYTVLTIIICDIAPQRDQFFCQNSLSRAKLVLSLFLHVQRTESRKCKHPVVKYQCYLYIFICVALIQKSGKCKG